MSSNINKDSQVKEDTHLSSDEDLSKQDMICEKKDIFHTCSYNFFLLGTIFVMLYEFFFGF